MKFCDLVQFMHHNYEVKKNAAEFVKILTDAILDDEALEKADFKRVLKKLSKPPKMDRIKVRRDNT